MNNKPRRIETKSQRLLRIKTAVVRRQNELRAKGYIPYNRFITPALAQKFNEMIAEARANGEME